MNIDDQGLLGSNSEIKYAPIRRNKPGERRGSVENLFKGDEKRDAIIQQEVAKPVLLNVEKTAILPLPISDALSSPRVMLEISPRTTKNELSAIYQRYAKPVEPESLSSSAKRVSGIFTNTVLHALTSLPEDKLKKTRQELERIFEILDYSRRTGIKSFEVLVGGVAKEEPLEALLDSLMKNDDIRMLLDSDPLSRMSAHTFVLKFILEEFNTLSKELHDFLQQFKEVMSEMTGIMGNSYELWVDDGQHIINVNDKYVDINSRTLILKTVGLARVNFEMIMMAARRGVKKEKLILHGHEEKEVKLQDSDVICAEAIAIYKALASMLHLPLKYTRESIIALIDDVLGRYQMVGRASENEIKEFKHQFSEAWPSEGIHTGIKVDWKKGLHLVKTIKKVVEANITFFQYSEWIGRCLSDHSAIDTKVRNYAVGGNPVTDVAAFFKRLDEEEKHDLDLYLDKKRDAIAGKIKEDKEKLNTLNLKFLQIKIHLKD